MGTNRTPGPGRIVRRLGSTPAQRGSTLGNCPDLFELDNGDFAVIGTVIDHTRLGLPPDAGVADHEVTVIVPRAVFTDARRDIPGS